jgi:hypothetical protein
MSRNGDFSIERREANITEIPSRNTKITSYNGKPLQNGA